MTAASDTPLPQPFLHELVTCVRAPTVALSDPDGQIRAGGARGVFRHDVRILSELALDVDGTPPVPVGHTSRGAGEAEFAAVVRHLGDPGADPTVTLRRHRRVIGDGIAEQFVLANSSRRAVTAAVSVRVRADFAGMDTVKQGRESPGAPPPAEHPDAVVWAGPHAHTRLQATGEPHRAVAADHAVRLTWHVTIAPGSRWTATVTATATSPAPQSPQRFPAATGQPPTRLTVQGHPILTRLVGQGVADIDGLTLADPCDTADVVAAAGSPWFLTLFGRDSLWTARFMLPAGTHLARGTLRALARRQGTRHDRDTGEAPGKILHEVRVPEAGMHGLPPVYFGTVDATALWVCLLHDAWQWGLPPSDVADLLEPLEAALRWLVEDADADGDGLLEYVDHSGNGLANQGWKDSGDAIQFPDGTLAAPPIVLCEAQAYAYEAATRGAMLLESFSRPGAARIREWAAHLRKRFRETFWVEDDRGHFPAVALDGAKRPVAVATSNLGHLLGTGLLDPTEAAAVARRLARSDLDCGHGLRTMSADAAGFNPLGYHTGSVWPHDTAIAVRGLVREGHAEVAASLAAGLLAAAPEFAHRLPELFGGTDGHRGEAVLAYPAACRPQAWSAAAVVSLLASALGLEADAPGGTVRITPSHEFASWFPVRVTGLQVAGAALAVSVDAAGRVKAETAAPLALDLPAGGLIPPPRTPASRVGTSAAPD